ncbi:MAG TPA: hypothetical protein VN604_00155 [Nitrospirota bacterium]|nr:hypothetical protein [Nitrospirota bacterium]
MKKTFLLTRHPLSLLFVCAFFLLLCGGNASAAGLRDFTSDGCSLFPDGTIKDRTKWCDCCLQHDIAYWRGGTEAERKQADEALRDCVLERTKDKVLAETMYLGVRAGGHPAFPTWYRWAYGWDYGRGHQPLNEDEQMQVREKIDRYQKEHPDGYCKEKHSDK